MKLKRLSLPFVIAVVLLSLTACGSGSTAPAKTSAASGTSNSKGNKVKPVELNIMWWGSNPRHQATLKALDAYKKLHPNISFQPEYSGWSGYWDKMATLSAGRNMPDILQMDAAYLNDYAGRKQLADLSAGIDVSKVSKSLVDSGKFKGKLYAIPLGNNAKGIVYNKAEVKKLGITAPRNNWTWNDFWKFGEEAKAKLGVGHYALPDWSSDYLAYKSYQLAEGKGQPVTKDGKFNIDKQTWLDWENKYIQLRKEKIVPPADVQVTDKQFDPQQDLMLTGKILLRTIFAAEISAFDSIKPNTFGLVTMPRDKESGSWLKPSMFWSISANSKHIQEAKQFVDWFINNQNAGDILGTSRGIPVSSTVLNHLKPSFSKADNLGVDLVNITAKDAQPFFATPKGWAGFRNNDYKTITQKVMFGKETPEQAWSELVKKANEYQN